MGGRISALDKEESTVFFVPSYGNCLNYINLSEIDHFRRIRAFNTVHCTQYNPLRIVSLFVLIWLISRVERLKQLLGSY